MEISFDVLPTLLLSALLFLGVYLLLYYKFTYSIVDPLFIFVITTSFSSVLTVSVVPEFEDVVHFFSCQIALWVGFAIVYKKYEKREKDCYVITGQILLKQIAYIFLIIYVFTNLYIGYVKGFALLSSSPSESKIANFQEGFGFFRKINWSIGTFVSTSLIYLILLKQKKIDIFFLIVVIFFFALDGSKSSMLQIAISAGIILYHPAFQSKRQFLRSFQKYLPLLLTPVIVLFFVVLFKENDTADEAFFAFIKRLLYSADSILFYYQPVNTNYFDKYDFLDYVKMIFNPTLGFLRLQPYQETPGVIMLDNLFSSSLSNTGALPAPNTPFYIEAKIYFNFLFGILYSFFVGYIYARIRIYYFSIEKTSAFNLIFFASFFHLASAMIGDVNLAIVQVNDLLFFVLLPSVFLKFIFEGKIVIRE